MPTEADDSYRRAAQRLATACREEGLRAIVISSPDRKAGVTTAAVHLTHHLNEHLGLRALLVELNRSQPALAKRFKLNSGKSFETIAANRHAVGECIQKTKAGPPMIVAAGRRDSSADTVDTGSVLQRILEETKETHDLVLIDAPPILSDSDTMAAATVVPVMLLVVQAGVTPYEVIDRIRRDLEANKIRVFASILNKHKRFIPGWVYRALAR